MKTIVIPTDFSQNAGNAVEVGYSLAKQRDAQIIVIHCYQPFHSAFQPGGANKRDASRAREEAEQQMGKLQENLNKKGLDTVSMQFVCVPDELPEALDELSSQNPIDLVVMGTTGASGVKYHVLGSNTFNVAKQTRFPLLIVPIGATDFELKNIVFLTDFQSKDRFTWTQLIKVFGVEQVNYHLVHILDDIDDADAVGDKLDDWAQQLLDANGLEELSTQLIIGKENAQVVRKLAEQHNTDLLALTMIERTFWDKFLDKSLAKAVIMQSKVPVFVIP